MDLKVTKLIIFDLDGVLIDSRDMHYDALNRALAKVDEKYIITREEHLSAYDGLPTTRKLELLTEKKDLLESLKKGCFLVDTEGFSP